MAVTTSIKSAVNKALASLNLKLDTLTDEKVETERIERLRQSGHFAQPAFPLLPGVAAFTADALAEAFVTYRTDLDRLMRGGARPGGYIPQNNFYRSPDAEILYLMVRTLAPRRIVEVGSGNSTRIIRQAIADGGLSVVHVAIDPAPRSDVAQLVDRMFLARLEDAGREAEAHLAALAANDILFIDSSHRVLLGNDVARLYCVDIPALTDGVVVHVHDVFLPFDYPDIYAAQYAGWGEQYLLQVLLLNARHRVLWPGYYVQKLRPEVHERLPFIRNGIAQSFWLQKYG